MATTALWPKTLPAAYAGRQGDAYAATTKPLYLIKPSPAHAEGPNSNSIPRAMPATVKARERIGDIRKRLTPSHHEENGPE